MHLKGAHSIAYHTVGRHNALQARLLQHAGSRLSSFPPVPKTLDSRLGPRDYRRCAPARARKTPTRSLLQHTGHAESTQLLEAPLLVHTSRPTASAAAEARTQILFGPRAASCTSRRTLVAYHTVWRRHAPSRSNTFHIGAY